ncbi:MAG TPA: Gfo/Idh/MocA family oxidoreductase [Planctomycetaceae bacterium]|nr:Gfo/Idh/MocA family oxidoreductase [Planctomycetaceae bacterium]
MSQLDRREFLNESSLGVAALTSAAWLAQAQPANAEASERLQVGCMGVGGRASALMHGFARLKDCDVVVLCDVDTRKLPEAVEAVAAITGKKPDTVSDFRRLIDNPRLDAIVVGTPDHWHAIPTILACLAGKDVYVEKPDGHNIVEGQRMVAAQRREKRVVQMGTQSRSGSHFLSAMEFIRSGKLGKCLVAKAWESGKQGSIGRPPDSDPPAGVDYDMWLGAAPKRPFNIRRFHGNWRWFFDYGTGDLGNDGVHRLDVARWALSTAVEAEGKPPLGLPTTITSSGGKWYFDDMQEWPDTLQVNYEYAGSPGRLLTYEMRIWSPYSYLGEPEAAAVFGDEGYIVIGNRSWKAYGQKGKLLAEDSSSNGEAAHLQNFVDCVKSRGRPNADLETVGHPSSLLCHAGNIAWRTGQRLVFDPQTETFVGNAEANALRTRPEYRKPWVLPEV